MFALFFCFMNINYLGSDPVCERPAHVRDIFLMTVCRFLNCHRKYEDFILFKVKNYPHPPG